jgi:hypothetical protein
VVDRNIRLAWMNDDGTGFMKRAGVLGLGITYDMLIDAISEAGGSTRINGQYPINDDIKQTLKKLLM